MLTLQRCGLCLLALAPAAGAEDAQGDADPAALPRYPESRIVAFAPRAAARAYEFVTGRVDRRQRDRRVDSSRRVRGQLLRVTYQAPAGTRLADVVAHYEALVAKRDADVAFSCHGRDCGRSTAWANDVFGVKELVAPDSAQFYLAAALPDGLAAVYVVQRGNRRVYAHLDWLEPDDAPAEDVAAALRQHGYAVLANVAPAADGTLDGAGLASLRALAGDLATFSGGGLHVVCHLPGDPAVALAQARRCAEQAADALRQAGVEAAGFGAGPLLPRSGAAQARLELVAPSAPR